MPCVVELNFKLIPNCCFGMKNQIKYIVLVAIVAVLGFGVVLLLFRSDFGTRVWRRFLRGRRGF